MGLKAFIAGMRGFMPTGVVNQSVMTDDVIDLYLSPWSTEDGERAFFPRS